MKIFFKNLLIIILNLVAIWPCLSASYGGGTGEPESPYKIATPEHFNTITIEPNDWAKYFMLVADINMGGVECNTIGNETTLFTGNFDGQGFVIRNLNINKSSVSNVGLFGHTNNCIIKNLGVEDINVVGNTYVGGLVGQKAYSNIVNCYVDANITGEQFVGGLVGFDNSGIISNCYVRGSVTCIGNLFGGGLIGKKESSIEYCYSSANVDGNGVAVGGLIGKNYGSVTNCFWDVNTSGQISSSGGVGKTTVEMQTISTFTGWDFVNNWRMCQNDNGYPKLNWEYAGYGDFVCPDGVSFSDFVILADGWLTDSNLPDLDKDNIVDYNDLTIFSENWLQ